MSRKNSKLQRRQINGESGLDNFSGGGGTGLKEMDKFGDDEKSLARIIIMSSSSYLIFMQSGRCSTGL